MRARIAVLLAALLVAPLVLVAILLRGTVPRKQAADPVIQTTPKPPSAPVATAAPGVDVRGEVERLLQRLAESVQEKDLEAESRIQNELQKIGFPAVEPMRTDVLGNPELIHRDSRFHQSVVRTLMGMASPETGAELLKSWIEVDRSKYQLHIRVAVYILRQFADVIARHPGRDLPKEILALYAQAKTREIRRSLIELMGLLLSRFPALRDELLRIMLEDPEAELRAHAVLALASNDPAAALPAMLRRMESLLAGGGLEADQELYSLATFVLKAVPIDQALDRLKELAGKTEGTYASTKLNTLGRSLGQFCMTPGDGGLEVVLGRASSEKSANMQLVYLGAVMAAPLKKFSDARLSDLALAYLGTSSDDWVRSHSLSAITSLNRDESTVLAAYEQAWKIGGRMPYFAAGQLKFYLGRNPESAAAAERLRGYLGAGPTENRLQFIKGLSWGGGALTAEAVTLLQQLAVSDPDEAIREAAVRTLRATGNPPK